MQTYTVQQGDTLYGISKQFGVSVEDIKAENNLTTDSITPNQVLKIPTSTSTITYTVKKGDSLYSIASKYDTTVNELISLNNLTSNILSIGQQLKIPVQSDSDDIIYTVKSGDSLYSIAIKFNTSVQAIKNYNNLTSDVLSIGQTLKIPNNQDTNTIFYTVKRGDSLYSIATTYNTTVSEIKRLNNLSSDTLSIGQLLQIPVTIPTNPSTDTYINYIVTSGDSLYKIAKEYNMTVDELMRINDLSSTTLSIGQVLKVKGNDSIDDIPSGAECIGTGYTEPTYETYTVKKGDNLYAIARRFNTSIDNLLLLNNLSNDNLSVGQVLKIREVS